MPRYGGKQRKIKNAEEFGQKIDEYIQHNREENREDIKIPTDFDLCEYLGIASQTLWDYLNNKDTYKGYSDQIKKLVDYREQFLIDLAVKNPKAASVAIFALKQPKNGGYVDKPTVQVEARELTIKTGEGMPKDSFS